MSFVMHQISHSIGGKNRHFFMMQVLQKAESFVDSLPNMSQEYPQMKCFCSVAKLCVCLWWNISFCTLCILTLDKHYHSLYRSVYCIPAKIIIATELNNSDALPTGHVFFSFLSGSFCRTVSCTQGIKYVVHQLQLWEKTKKAKMEHLSHLYPYCSTNVSFICRMPL